MQQIRVFGLTSRSYTPKNTIQKKIMVTVEMDITSNMFKVLCQSVSYDPILMQKLKY